MDKPKKAWVNPAWFDKKPKRSRYLEQLNLRAETGPFEHLYLGEFKESETEKILRELSQEYHERCDKYDALVCTDTRHGEPFPRTPFERESINLHSRAVTRDLKLRLKAEYGISTHLLFGAIQRYQPRQ